MADLMELQTAGVANGRAASGGVRPVVQEREAVAHYAAIQAPGVSELAALGCIERLFDVRAAGGAVVVVGCGPNPHGVQQLMAAGYDVVGVEPVAGFVESARAFLGRPELVLQGAAETLPFPDGSQRVVLLDSVLEHVDSPSRSLAEAYRVLAPGGVLYVYTTNRHRLSLVGETNEFRIPFYNWLPATVKEAYVHHHLHHDPRLANHSMRPAVHWWTYAELCRAGREAGFAHFYSRLDLVDLGDGNTLRARARRWLLPRVRLSPWLRALALMQYGNSIFMLKRPETTPAEASAAHA